jgi:enoyl-CoA hydratase
MTSSRDILFERDGRIARITLNRPAKMNALTNEMLNELSTLLSVVDRDPDLRVTLLTGAGENFCSGFDIKGGSTYALLGQPLQDNLGIIRSSRQLYQSVWNSRKPVVARVAGYSLAAGCYLQMLCDISVAADDAVLGHPAVAAGGTSALPLWSWYLGIRKAKEMLLTGKLVQGREAERIGLVNQSVPRSDLDATVEDITNQIADMPIDSTTITKEAMNTTADIQGLAAAFRTQGHANLMGRFAMLDADVSTLQRKTAEKVARLREQSSQEAGR